MVGIRAMIIVRLFLAALILFGTQVPEAGSKMDVLVDNALYKTGREYFEAERALRLAGSFPPIPKVSSLNTDPLDALILNVLREWRQPEAEEFDRALEYLDTLPSRLAETPITSPSPSGVAGFLSLHYGWRVADLMGVHLIKQSDWPRWRVSGVLLYLREQARPSTTAALIRFASQSRDEKWTAVALETIRAAKDPDLPAKVYSEERHAEKERRPLPPALKELMKPN
jgi:hypothetical protein